MPRHPAVAGHFYKASRDSLKNQVSSFIIPVADKKHALGILAPHAGFMYSGSVAGAVYSNIVVPKTIVLIGPNHTGLGAPVSIMSSGAWETPLGEVVIDEALAASILAKSSRIREDSLAHLREHSLEVQLPFIQYLRKDIKIVPIQMLDTRFETCVAVGRAVGEAIIDRIQGPGSRGQEKGKKEHDFERPLIVASSDMSHYELAATAKEQDFKAIKKILNLDPEGLYQVVRDHGITMCGYGPAVAMLVAVNLLNATHAELIKYANSGDANNDYEKVVGYAGIVVM